MINKREYANSIEVNGWDNMNAIKMMEMQDVKDCVSKPGHFVQMFAEIQKLKDATKGRDSHETASTSTCTTTSSTDSVTQTKRCKIIL